MIKLLANDLYRGLYYNKINSCRTIIPNSHIPNWYEADSLLITKSLFTHEIEIKLSLSDFKSDFKKQRSNISKHDSLKMRKCFPNRFSFLIPFNLKDKIEHLVPEYAGLYIFSHSKNNKYDSCVYESIKPPRLHNNKIDDKIYFKLLTNISFRYNNKLLSIPNDDILKYETEEHF